MRILRTRGFVFYTVDSANQLSIHGAVANWFEERVQQISDHSSTGTGNFVAEVNVESESKVALTVVSILRKQ